MRQTSLRKVGLRPLDRPYSRAQFIELIDGLTFGEPIQWEPLVKYRASVLSFEARFHHAYVVGKSGMGKTTLLESMIIKDLQQRVPTGLLVISPEQELFDRLLWHIPKHRAKHLIYIDPMYPHSPLIGINLFDLELPENLHPNERIGRIRQGASEIFTTLERATGDLTATLTLRQMLDQAVMALVQRPGSTIRDLPRLLKPEDTSLRAAIVRDDTILPSTREFWAEYDQQTTYSRYAENLLARFRGLLLPPLVNFLTTKGFSFHQALNLQPSIFFVNLSTVGEADRTLIAQLIISYLQQILLRRDPMPLKQRIPYFAYFDEFQRYAAENERSVQSIFQQMRKYRFALTLAHQNPDDIKGSMLSTVLGTVGTLAVMRLSGKDAAAMAQETLFKDSMGKLRPELLQTLPRGTAVIFTNDYPKGVWTQIDKPPSRSTTLKHPRFLMDYSRRCYGATPLSNDLNAHSKKNFGLNPPEPPVAPVLSETPPEPPKPVTPRKRKRVVPKDQI